MERIYTFIAACLIASSAMAQVGTTGSGVKYGLKAGVNFATVGLSGDDVDNEENDALKSLTSFHVGGFADIPVGTSFSIQPGLTLSGKGFKQKLEDEKFERNIMYLEIPVNAVYKLGGIYLGAGPYAAFAISGKDKGEYEDDDLFEELHNNDTKFTAKTQALSAPKVAETYDEKLKFGNSDDDDMKGTDFGINIMAGYRLSGGLNIGINYGLGLSNIVPSSDDYDYKAKNRVVSVSVGFSF